MDKRTWHRSSDPTWYCLHMPDTCKFLDKHEKHYMRVRLQVQILADMPEYVPVSVTVASSRTRTVCSALSFSSDLRLQCHLRCHLSVMLAGRRPWAFCWQQQQQQRQQQQQWTQFYYGWSTSGRQWSNAQCSGEASCLQSSFTYMASSVCTLCMCCIFARISRVRKHARRAHVC